MKTELKVRQQAIALHLQGWTKSEIARKVQRSRRWVHAVLGNLMERKTRSLYRKFDNLLR